MTPASLTQGRRHLPVFLGTCESAPDIQVMPKYKEVPTDGTGGVDGVGEDDLLMGETALVEATLTRWNERVYAAIAAKARPGAARGRLRQRDGVGSLMVRERYAYPLWIRFPYVAKAVAPLAGFAVGAAAGGAIAAVAAAVSGLANAVPTGYHFFRAYLIAPERLGSGTKPRKITLFWKCRYDTEIGVLGSDVVSPLYDHSMTGLPPPD